MTIEENHDCNQCGAVPGERHRGWDDLARCAESGMQAIQCRGRDDEPEQEVVDDDYDGDIEAYLNDYAHHNGRCRLSVWDGEYPGVKKCRELGWYHEYKDPFTGEVSVSEDLNRLYSAWGTLRWDPELEDFVLR